MTIQPLEIDFFRDALYDAEEDFIRELPPMPQRILFIHNMKPAAIRSTIAELWSFAVEGDTPPATLPSTAMVEVWDFPRRGDGIPPTFGRVASMPRKHWAYFNAEENRIWLTKGQRCLLAVIHEVAHAVTFNQFGFNVSHGTDFQDMYVALIAHACGADVGDRLGEKLAAMRQKVLGEKFGARFLENGPTASGQRPD